MACRCNERREAFIASARALAKGDGQAVASQAKIFATTTVQDLKDAGSVLKQQAQAARARLMQRRR